MYPSVFGVFQLTVVVDRILAFSLAYPLAKFLNGLEMVLSKAQVSSLCYVLSCIAVSSLSFVFLFVDEFTM